MRRKPFEIIFEDNYLIILNKTAKILVQAPCRNDYTLTSFLERDIKKKIYPCHRLDRETTGLILYAKDRYVKNLIIEQFREGKIRKKYIAFVDGRLRNKEAKLEGYIIDREGKRFGEKPKIARTTYRVLEEFDSFSVVEAIPITGRTNQIRIQFANLGNPILGDTKYAFRRDFKLKFKRLALHAFFLSFLHPVNRKQMDFKIDLPEDMKNFLDSFRKKVIT